MVGVIKSLKKCVQIMIHILLLYCIASHITDPILQVVVPDHHPLGRYHPLPPARTSADVAGFSLSV